MIGLHKNHSKLAALKLYKLSKYIQKPNETRLTWILFAEPNVARYRLPKVNHMEKKCSIFLSSTFHNWTRMAIVNRRMATRPWTECQQKKQKRSLIRNQSSLRYNNFRRVTKLFSFRQSIYPQPIVPAKEVQRK